MSRAIVVGAGISGLTSAFRLQQRGFDVTVLEASDHVAGKMATLRRDGFTLNRGAAVLPASYASLRQLAVDAGHGDWLAPFGASLVVPREGTNHKLRISGAGALVDGLRTGLISARGKLELRRLAADTLRVRRSMSYTDHAARATVDGESVGAYCARRFGPETHDWLIDPLTRGLWVVDADPISTVELFFALVRMFGAGMLSHRGGIDGLCVALADALDLRTGATVRAVERVGGGARVTWEQDGSELSDEAAGCVIAMSAPHVPGIHPGLDPRLAEILASELRYIETITASFALSRRPAGGQLAFVLPEREDAGLGIVPFNHNSAPDSAPAGKGLVSGYWTGEWSRSHFDLDDDALLQLMWPSMERVVPGIESVTEFVNIERWRPSTLQSRPGMHRVIAELTSRLDPADPIQLAGDYFGPPNIESTVLSAEAAARNLSGPRSHFRSGGGTIERSARLPLSS